MKLSCRYIKSIKDQAKEYDSISHEFLVQGGFVDQVTSGVFTWLTPGLNVLNKIEQIVREELDAIDSLEIVMPNLIQKKIWEQAGLWDNVDVLYKLKSRYGDREYGLGFSHEEVVTPLAAKYIHSYKDLPLSLYQINTKFRDEARAKSGILRGREFRMKDMYSFHATQEDFDAYYANVMQVYLKIFKRFGLDDVKVTEASGGDFTEKMSHEFNVLTPAGEVDLVYCTECTFAQNEEVVKIPLKKCPKCGEKVAMGKAIEIGNIFTLESRFSDAFNVKFTDEGGSRRSLITGCYGIGTSRLVGALVELHHDEKGIIWPEAVAPFQAHLVGLSKTSDAFAQLMYRSLQKEGISVLFDDREDVTAGEKFAVADLIGCPIRLVVSDRNQESIELKLRTDERTRLYSAVELIAKLKDYYA